MKITILLILFTSLSCSSILGETYTLTSKDGRELKVKDPHYDGADELKVTRTSDGRTIKFSPKLLTEDSWRELNHKVTERMGVGFQVKPRGSKKETNTTWATDYGSHESTYHLKRTFNVSVTSVNHFIKPITVTMFFVDGDDKLDAHKITHDLCRNNPFTLGGKVQAEQYVLHLNAIGITYKDGPEVSNSDYVVIVQHKDGSIAETYATNKSALDAVTRALATQ